MDERCSQLRIEPRESLRQHVQGAQPYRECVTVDGFPLHVFENEQPLLCQQFERLEHEQW